MKTPARLLPFVTRKKPRPITDRKPSLFDARGGLTIDVTVRRDPPRPPKPDDER